MHNEELLNQLIVVFALSIVVFITFHRLRVPTIVGFLFTGILSGPYVLGIVNSTEQVNYLAEIGVILLLFTIGIEFSLKSLMQIRRSVFLGGTVQVILTSLMAFIISYISGFDRNKAIFMGLMISLSSTAIVLKLMQDRAEVDSLHGKTTVGILVFQDIAVVPILLFTPFLAGISTPDFKNSYSMIFKGAGIFILVIFAAKWLIPLILDQVAKLQNRELFLLSVIVICFSVAWATSTIGLSLALGAFLAGLIISESEYNHQALEHVVPFKDVFASIFFISVGMLLDLKVFFTNAFLIILITIIVIAVKLIAATIAVMVLGYPLRTGVMAGFKLAQIGEFSFILAGLGMGYGLLNLYEYQIFIAVSVLSMALTPLLIKSSDYVGDAIIKLPLHHKLKTGFYVDNVIKKEKKKDHLIIIGLGLNGQNVVKASSMADIPYVIIESDINIVKEQRRKGETIIHGDSTHEAVLRYADVENARVIVIAISDIYATRKTVGLITKLNPKARVIVRTRYVQEVELLHELGASEVIPEELETSIEIFAKVLDSYHIPMEEIKKFIDKVRSNSYATLRDMQIQKYNLIEIYENIPDFKIEKFRVLQNSKVSGKTLENLGLRKKYGVTAILIQRDLEVMPNPAGDTVLLPEDIVIVAGHPEDCQKCEPVFYEN